MKYILIFLLLFVVNVSVGLSVYLLSPNLRSYMTDEGGLVEDTSALLFLSSFFVGLFLYFKGNKKRHLLLFLSGLGLLGFLDEISFAQQRLGFDGPSINNKGIDSAHDFIEVIFNYLQWGSHNYVLELRVLIISCLILLLIKYRVTIINYIKKQYINPIAIMLFIFILLVGISQFVDMGYVHSSSFDFVLVEEILEMNAGLAFLFLCIIVHKYKY